MTVAELISLLQTKPQDLEVIYEVYSEYQILRPEEISVTAQCEPRNDGWIQRARPDMPQREYLTFPGN